MSIYALEWNPGRAGVLAILFMLSWSLGPRTPPGRQEALNNHLLSERGRKEGRVGRNEGRKEEKGSRRVRLQGPVSVTAQALRWPLTSRDLCRAWQWAESWSILCWWLGFPWMRGLTASICTPRSSPSSCSTCSRGGNKWGRPFCLSPWMLLRAGDIGRVQDGGAP